MVVEAWLAARCRGAHRRPSALETPSGQLVLRASCSRRARAGAGELRALGVAPGERVAIALPPGLAFAQALHACLLLGAVAVPVDLRLAERERGAIAGAVRAPSRRSDASRSPDPREPHGRPRLGA